MKNLLIMMRHGQSEWNKADVFTGWADIPLSAQGIEEALKAGEKIKKLPIDVIFMSTLVRAQATAMLAMSVHEGGKIPKVMHPEDKRLDEWGQVWDKEMEKKCIPVHKAWQLNERFYGQLQGLNKQATREKYGVEQVKIWRRSYDVAPPGGESLEMTAKRTIPYFKENVLPLLNEGKNVFISAHGNSLRSIIMYLDNLTKEQVVDLELATGEPIFYSIENGSWRKTQI